MSNLKNNSVFVFEGPSWVFQKDLIFAYLGVVLSMIFVPFSLEKGIAIPVLGIVFLYALYMLFCQKKGCCMLAISLCYCLPGGALHGMESYIGFKYISYCSHFILLFSFIYYKVIKHKTLKTNIPFIFGLIYLVLTFGYGETIPKVIVILFSTQLAFCVGSFEKITHYEYIKIYSIIFLCVALHGILEYNFDSSPYKFIYSTMSNYGSSYAIKRCVALFGNPLLLCSVIVFMLSFIFVEKINTGKLNVILIMLCAYLGIAVVSRTIVFAFVFLFLVYACLSRIIISPPKILTAFIGIIFLYLFLNYYFPTIIENLNDRFANSDTLHRQSAFGTTINVLSDKIFGLGIKDFGVLLQNYTTIGFIDGFGTLDNFFATQFCTFGIIGLFYIVYYLYYNIKMFKLCNKKSYLWNANIMALVYYILVGFSFDLETYYQLNVPYYIYMGVLYQDTKNENIICYE